MTTPLISVVVCTYNRSNLVRKALGGLCDQSMDPEKYEVLIVDNNSTDHTRKVVEEFAANHSNVRYVLELQQGVSYARNRGAKEAKADYIGYCDDDCELPKEWLSLAEEIIQQVAPPVFGGPYYASYNTPKPGWYKNSYGSRDFGSQPRRLNENEYLIGCNFFVSRNTLETSGGFQKEFGMNGNKVGYGEETELQKRIREILGKDAVYYDPRLFVYHLVRQEQMTLPWITRMFIARGRYRAMISPEKDSHERSAYFYETARTFAALSVDFFLALWKRDRKQYAFMQNYFYERTSNYIVRLGRLYEKHVQSNRRTMHESGAN